MQDLISALEQHEPNVGAMTDGVNTLMQQVDDKSPDAVRVKQEVNDTDDKYKDTLDKLKERRDKLQDNIGNARVFQDSLQEVEAWLPEATERVAAQKPISVEPEAVKEQLDEVQV